MEAVAPSRAAADAPLLAICGAGIGGLAAAAAVQRWGGRVTVYERDAEFDARAQGYGLTMQQGGSALKALGAESLGSGCLAATLHMSFTSDGTVVGRYGLDARATDPAAAGPAVAAAGGGSPDEEGRGKPKRKRKGKGARRNFLIPRQQLRQHLLGMLTPGTVQWGCCFDAYEAAAPAIAVAVTGARAEVGNVLLRFAAGHGRAGAEQVAPEPVRASLLVGADGIFSRVAKQRLGADHTALDYSGVLVVLGITALSSDGVGSHELLAKCNTVTETVDGSARIYTMPFSRSHHMWQLSVPMALAEARAVHEAGPAALLAQAMRIVGSWHDPLPALVGATAAADVTGYPVFDRPPLPHSAFTPTADEGSGQRSVDSAVTLLGDAVHPMAPFKGQGANQALLDGVLLAQELERSVFGRQTRAAAAALSHHPDHPEHAVEGGNGKANGPTNVDAESHPMDEEVQSTEEALARFEVECLRRSAVKVQASRSTTRKLHADVSCDFMKARLDPTELQEVPRSSTQMLPEHTPLSRLCVGLKVQVLSKKRRSAYTAMVSSEPDAAGEAGAWGVRAVRPGGEEMVGAEKRVDASHLAERWEFSAEDKKDGAGGSNVQGAK